MAKYDDYGREVPDPTPVSIPSGMSRPLQLHEQIKRMLRTEVSRLAADREKETFEEADDFDVDEDGDPLSPYEIPEGLPERAAGPVESLDGAKEPAQAALNLGDPGASGAPSSVPPGKP